MYQKKELRNSVSGNKYYLGVIDQADLIDLENIDPSEDDLPHDGDPVLPEDMTECNQIIKEEGKYISFYIIIFII